LATASAALLPVSLPADKEERAVMDELYGTKELDSLLIASHIVSGLFINQQVSPSLPHEDLVTYSYKSTIERLRD
jgi:hypothetical protein